MRQLTSELKGIKKGSTSISEYVLCIKTIFDFLPAIGDPINEQDQIDAILDGLPDEYSYFVTMIYGRHDSPSLFDIEALLLVQEALLDKFRQELAISNVSVNVAQASQHATQYHTHHSDPSNGNDYQSGARGRGLGGRFRGQWRCCGNGNRPLCQLCGKYGRDSPCCYKRSPYARPLQNWKLKTTSISCSC